MTAAKALPLEQTTAFALFMQQQSGPIEWELLRIAFLQEHINFGRRDRWGRPDGSLLPSALPCLQSLLSHEFEIRPWAEGCRLLLVPDRVLEPGRLYRFSFWIDLDDSLADGGVEAFCTVERSRFFLFSQSRRAFGPDGRTWGRLSYFVAVPEKTRWAMRILLLECDSAVALFQTEKRSERSQPRKPKPKGRRKRAIRSERRSTTRTTSPYSTMRTRTTTTTTSSTRGG